MILRGDIVQGFGSTEQVRGMSFGCQRGHVSVLFLNPGLQPSCVLLAITSLGFRAAGCHRGGASLVVEERGRHDVVRPGVTVARESRTWAAITVDV